MVRHQSPDDVTPADAKAAKLACKPRGSVPDLAVPPAVAGESDEHRVAAGSGGIGTQQVGEALDRRTADAASKR